MKLLLTSDGLTTAEIANEFLKLADKPVSYIRLGLVVPNAIESEIELYYFNLTKNKLLEIGLVESNIKVLDLSNEKTLRDIEDIDVLYVCGGNTYYILHKIREAGFDNEIKQFVKRGKIYVGVSAGSIIAGSDIEIAGWGSEGDENSIDLKDLTGLNFTDIAIFPHYKEVLADEVKEFKSKVNYPVVTLTDNQAMLIINNEEKFIES